MGEVLKDWGCPVGEPNMELLSRYDNCGDSPRELVGWFRLSLIKLENEE